MQKILVIAPILERVAGLDMEKSGSIPAQRSATTAGVKTFNGSVLLVKIGNKHQKAVKNRIDPDNKDKRSILF